MEKSLRQVYNEIVDEYTSNNSRKASRTVILADRKFNEWIENPTISGAEFAKHNRAFIKFCCSFRASFGDLVRKVQPINDAMQVSVNNLAESISGDRYRYHPEELVTDASFLFTLGTIIKSQCVFHVNCSSVKEFNSISIAREYPYGEVTVSATNEIDETPELFDDAAWELYKRSPTEREMKLINAEYVDGGYDYIPSSYTASKSVVNATPADILKLAIDLLADAKAETENQWETAKEIVKTIIG